MLQLHYMATLISIGQVLDHSLEHCRKHYKELLAIVLWMVAASVPTVASKLVALTDTDQALTNGDWLSFSLALLGALLAGVVSFWMYATLTSAIADQAANKRINLSQLYHAGWNVFWKYLGLTILIGLIFLGLSLMTLPGLILLLIGASPAVSSVFSGLGLPLLFIGGLASLAMVIKLTVQLAFSPFILLLEKRSIIDSITGSMALVRGRWWATLLRFAIPKIIYFLAFFVIGFVVFQAIALLMTVLSTSSQAAVMIIYTLTLFLSVLLSVIVVPFIVATDYYLYDSLQKTR